MPSTSKQAKNTNLDLDEAYAPAPTLFARVAAPNPELDIALKVIAEQRARIDLLENEVMTDAMTGTLNKRGFMKAMSRELDRTNRAKEAKTILVLFDLDGLKHINDTLGHLAGDAYINFFARELQRCIRTTDYMGRVGGDEFALLMTDGEPELMETRLETIMRTVNGMPMSYNDHELKLRASHGTAVMTPGRQLQDVIESADARLYSCKAERKRA